MSPEAVLNELKEKRLPTYGTGQERRDRLKKQYGIAPKAKSAIGANTQSSGSMLEMGMNAGGGGNLARRPTTTDKID
tara:strand:+ start:630 stop:860 length:231 start_codon:yes stop_codon:yes gene_type:complete